MECVYVTDAVYTEEYKIHITFNTGESGTVDLKEYIENFDAAAPLRDQKSFANFYLDSWPTLAWECGFDVAPEALYRLATGKELTTLSADAPA